MKRSHFEMVDAVNDAKTAQERSITAEALAKEIARVHDDVRSAGDIPTFADLAKALLPFIQPRAAGVQGVTYDRELIATMLHEGASVQKFTADAIREQIRLLRAADNADAARVRTVSRPPKDAGAVPMPAEPVLFDDRTGEWGFDADQLRAYGDAREASGRADSVLYEVANNLMLLVEGPGSLRWEDGEGFRLKDTSEWARFYVEVKNAKERTIPQHPPAEPADSLFVGAVKKLVIASRTSGGTAGRDDGLCAALDAVEAMLVEPAARAQAAVGEPAIDAIYNWCATRGLFGDGADEVTDDDIVAALDDYEGALIEAAELAVNQLPKSVRLYSEKELEACESSASAVARAKAFDEVREMCAPLGYESFREAFDALGKLQASPAHAGAGDAEALARKIFEAHREQYRRTPLWPMNTWEECEQSTRDHWTNIARRLAGGKA